MKKITGAILIVFLTFSIACDHSTAVPQSKEITEKSLPILKRERDYRLDVISKDGPLFGKIDDKENLYVYYLKNQDGRCEILKLSTDLELREKFFIDNGVGPGEARNPRIYGGGKGFIIVWDAPAQKYIKFDTNFKLLDEIKLTENPGTFLYSGARYVPEHNFVLDGFLQFITFPSKSFIHIYTLGFTDDKKIRKTRLFESPQKFFNHKNNKYIIARPIHFGYYFGYIYILDKRVYRLIKMDIQGNILKDLKIPFESKSFSKAERIKWIKKCFPNDNLAANKFDLPEELYPACWLMQVGEGIAVGRCDSYDPDTKKPVTADYFDVNLNFLGKLTLPYFYLWNHPSTGQSTADINFYSKDGKLYFFETDDGDEYRIVRCAIEYEKN